MMLDQHETAQFGAEMPADSRRRCCRDRLPVRCQPALAPQRRISNGMGRRRPVQPRVVARLGYVEHARHRGNREAGLVRAHEPEEPDGSVPASRANQAVAFERISRSSRSCLFSRRILPDQVARGELRPLRDPQNTDDES